MSGFDQSTPYFDKEKLYDLLPAIHRIRDDEQGRPLKALLGVIAEQINVIEENIEQLYDDQFIETCAGWVIPYIGDLIGFRTLYDGAFSAGNPRAEVAHTIALRRRKGTASVLEQVARDVTGWNARAVEFFQILATTVYMNHVRKHSHYAPDLRGWEPLEQIGTAFDRVAHTVDVRRIASRRGRHNIPNIGIFLFPIEDHRLTHSTAVRVNNDDRRWRISALNHDAPIYNNPEPEDQITHIAEPQNVPLKLSRRVLREDVLSGNPQYYGENLSLALYLNGSAVAVPVADIRICNLSDDGAGSWIHLPPAGKFAIDPVLGRIGLPAAPVPPITSVEVTHHFGFPAEIAGGEYERRATFIASPALNLRRVPEDDASITAALASLAGSGVVQINDNRRYEEALNINVPANGTIEIRARNERRPSLVLTGEMVVTGGAESSFALNGVLVSGEKVRVPAGGGNQLRNLRITHSTLVPGWALSENGLPTSPDEPSLIVEIADTRITVNRSIVGAIRAPHGATLELSDSILDATRIEGIACQEDGGGAGPALTMQGSTSIGKLHVTEMPLISNSLLLAELEPGDTWAVPIRSEQRQSGCVRFSWLLLSSLVPRRYRCQPEEGQPLVSPRVLSLRYGTPVYCWLSMATSDLIRRGAADDGEMGVYYHLLASQRETNLRVRLAEYLRAGHESGIFYEIGKV